MEAMPDTVSVESPWSESPRAGLLTRRGAPRPASRPFGGRGGLRRWPNVVGLLGLFLLGLGLVALAVRILVSGIP